MLTSKSLNVRKLLRAAASVAIFEVQFATLPPRPEVAAPENLQLLQPGYSWFLYGDAVTQHVALNRNDADFFCFMSTLKF